MAKKSKLQKFLSKDLTGNQVFLTFAAIFAILLTYNFTFGSSSGIGMVLGREDSENMGGRSMEHSEEKDEMDDEDEWDDVDEIDDVDDMDDDEMENENEMDSDDDYQMQYRGSNPNASPTLVRDRVETRTNNPETGEMNEYQYQYEEQEQGEQQEQEMEQFMAQTSDNDLAKYGEPVERRKSTKLQKLLFLVPVEIETEEVVNMDGDVVDEEQSLLGKLLDLISF